MNKLDYKEIEKSAHRSKYTLYLNLLYTIVFIMLVAMVLSKLTPRIYYQYFDQDTITFSEGEKPSYLPTSSTNHYSEREIYRQNWYELTQNNRLPGETYFMPEHKAFGKEQSHSIVKRIGNQDYEVAMVTEDYFYGKVNNLTFESLQNERLVNYKFYPEQEWSTKPENLIELLRHKDKFGVANLEVVFNLPKTKEQLAELKDVAKVTVIRYGVDYPNSTAFGFPALYFDDQTAFEMTEELFIEKLVYLKNHYSTYENLLLDNQSNQSSAEIINSSGNEVPMMPSNLRSPFNSFLNGNPVNFKDAQEFIEDNGIKYGRLFLTGRTDQLADWLESNLLELKSFKVEEIRDWNASLEGRND